MNIGHIVGICISFLKTVSYLRTVLAVLFFLSIATAFTKVLCSWLRTSRFKKKINTAKLPQFIKKLSLKYNLEGKIIIFHNPKPVAFCLGIGDPRVYLSTKLLALMNKKEIEAIILHEKYHLINRDTFLAVTVNFLRGLFVLFPIVTDIMESLIRQKETNADQYSLNYFKNPKIVLSAFKKLISCGSTTSPSLAYLVSFFPADTLEHRIKILKREKTFVLSFNVKHLLVSFFTFITLLSFLLLTTWPSYAKQNEAPSVCLKGHNCHLEC